MECQGPQFIEHYLQNTLSKDEKLAFERHCAQCAACQARLTEAEDHESLLQTLVEAIQTSPPDRPGLEPPMSLARVTELLGTRYRVIRFVGQGMHSQVFQAIDSVLNRQVAIKFLSPDRQRVPSRPSHPWREARLMGQLNHPYVAQIYEVGQKNSVRFIVMEWVDGLPFTEAWRSLDLNARLRLYAKVLEAVAAAHKRQITHRDIKPGNILVMPDLTPKILDFGIALDASTLGQEDPTLYRGTPAYSAPEQITHPDQMSPATDVYSLGVLLYQVLTDQLPFDYPDTKRLFDAIKTEYPRLPTALNRDIPMALQNICLTAMEKDPIDRYQDANALRHDIQRFLKDEKVWARPSYVTHQIEQDIHLHSQTLTVWQENDWITHPECEHLKAHYTRLLQPSDPSIIEARRLSLSQVFLYLGGWVVLLGCVVLFYKTWTHIPLYVRPIPAIAATTLIAGLGLWLWRRKETRLSVGFLATANLLVPVTLLLTLAQWQILSAATLPWGQESVYEALTLSESRVLIGNTQLYVSAWTWVACSVGLAVLTGSSLFGLFTVLASLSLLTSYYIISGLWSQPLDHMAGAYVGPALILSSIGALLDRSSRRKYAWSPSVVGAGLLIVSLTLIALSPSTLFGWIGTTPSWLSPEEAHGLSLASNGLIFLVLAGLCQRLNTPLQRNLSTLFNWLGPVHILGSLRLLDLDSHGFSESHRMLYRGLLPAASLAFVFISVSRQMKSFFFSGLAGLTASVHKLTIHHLDKFFVWPVWLIVTGLLSMIMAWIVPKWHASKTLKNTRDASSTDAE
jgi:serine/threonine protein kinase